MKVRRFWTQLGSVGAMFAMAGVALGAEAQEAGAAGESAPVNPVAWHWVPFFSAIVIFGVALGLLAKFVWPKLLKGLEDREKKIRDEIYAAEEARKRANEALKEYEKSLAEARAEANKMIEATKAEQSRMAADLKAKAEVEVNQLRESAMHSIEAAKRAALSEIYAETASLATAVAGKILEREVNEQDQQRLVNETVERFMRSNGSAVRSSPSQQEVVHGSPGHSS